MHPPESGRQTDACRGNCGVDSGQRIREQNHFRSPRANGHRVAQLALARTREFEGLNRQQQALDFLWQHAILISNETGESNFRNQQTESGCPGFGQCFRAGSPCQSRQIKPSRGLLAGGGGRPHRFVHLRELRDRA